MTTQVLSITTTIWEQVANFFSGWAKSIAYSRSLAANQEVARYLIREYPNMTQYELLMKLNEQSYKDIYGND